MVLDDVGLLVTEIGKLALWLQAVGVIIVLYVIFQVIFLFMNLKRFRHIDKIQKDMARIEKKIDLLVKKK